MNVWGVGALIAVTVCARPALAAEEDAEKPPRHFGGQRNIGFGPALGWYSGIGGMVEVESGPIGLAMSGGYLPLFIFGNDRNDRNNITFDYYSAAQLTADLIVGPIWQTQKIDISFLGGYRFNSVLGHGFGLGVRVAADLSRALRLEFHGTPSFFPSATSRLRDRDYPAGVEPSAPWVQGGIGLSLVYYP